MPPRQSSPVLTLHGVSYQTESGQKIEVSEAELGAQVAALAQCNGWKVDDLLANRALAAEQPLDCRLVKHVPPGWSLTDDSGYVMMRFSKAYSVRGSSFCRDASANKVGDYMPPRRRGKSRTTTCHFEHVHAQDGELPTPPRRTQRQKTSPLSYLETSPPGTAKMGANQPLMERYHRVLFAATMPTMQLEDGWVLHSCGNKNCAVVAHLYMGDQPTNSLDARHHRNMPNTSRIDLPKLQ